MRTLGRVRSLSPRGGPSASIVLIVLCSAIYLLDLLLPTTRVQSSPWEVAPVLRKAVDAVVRRQSDIDALAQSARARGDSETVAKLLAERSELDVLREDRVRRLETAQQS